MDELIRKLEQQVATDPSIRPQLLATYVRNGDINMNTVKYCAELGNPVARQVLPALPKNIQEGNFPKKVYLVFGLGCTTYMEQHLSSDIDESLSVAATPNEILHDGFEDLRAYVLLCRKFAKQVLPAFLERKQEVFDYQAYDSFYKELTIPEFRGLLVRELKGRIRRTEYSIASPQHLVMPDFLRAYFESYSNLAVAVNKKPKINALECAAAAGEALTLKTGNFNIAQLQQKVEHVTQQGLHFLFRYFLGPLIVS